MKINRYLLFIVLAGTYLNGYSQKTTYNWFFGNKVGLNFSTNPPIAIHNTALSAIEGSSAISDANGNVLFYCNGMAIFNRKNQPMSNGVGLNGDLSSTCNSVIVPMPGNDSLYYVFTVDASNEFFQPFLYSVVNMKADNGYGAVIRKNVGLNDPVFEKIAAVRHCNKRDVWIVVKTWDTDEYDSYLLSDTGITTIPVVSHTGFVVSGEQNSMIGAMKFSSDGKKLAAAYAGSINKVELMQFDNSTGLLSNGVVFNPNTTPPSAGLRGIYGAEFSPNGKLLYISANNTSQDNTVLYQFDISSMNRSLIETSKQVLAQLSDWVAGALQAGPDKKIYLTMWKDSALSVIENPDVYGSGAGYVYNKILIGTASSIEALQSGLPTFIASDLNDKYAGYNFSVIRSSCTSLSVNFSINYTADIDSVKWNFGDGQKTTQLAPFHTYLSAGSYPVTLTIYRTDCSGNEPLMLHQQLIINNSTSILPQDQSFCDLKSLNIKSQIPGDTYLWSTGITTDSINITSPGLYWLEIQTNGCLYRDSISITDKPVQRVYLGNNNSTVCVENPLVLNPSISGINYLWNTGETTASLIITKPGSFWLQFENETNCIVSDTVNVTLGNCEIYFPTAFTPNGDGINDQFGLINHTSAKTFELQVYNRYGQVVYQTNDQFQKWDGTMNGKKQQVGTYAWIMRYRSLKGLQQIVKGTVLLIR